MSLRLTFLAELVLNLASKSRGEGIRIKHYNGLWQHNTAYFKLLDFHPKYTMKNSALDWVFNDIYFKHYKPKNGDICIDVGSGIGTETLFMSKAIGPKGKVFSIEAALSTFNVLKKNIKLNSCQNVIAKQLAISNNEDPVFIEEDIESHIKNRLSNVSSQSKMKVESMTMDKFIQEHNINTIDFLKVNIEGAEQLLIEQFNSIKNVKNVAISCHDFLGKRESNDWLFTKDKIHAFLSTNDFEIYTNNIGIDYADDWLYGKNLNL